MKTASDIFDEAARKRVDEAVAAAEARTGAEIVPVVATASGRYDRAEDLFGLATGLLFMTVTWLLLPDNAPEPGSWAPHWAGLAELLALLAAVALGFVVGAWLASRAPAVRALLVRRSEMEQDVIVRAHQAFADNRVHHTQGRGGLLIYVSLVERQAVILADQQAHAALGQEAIDALCKELTDRLRRGDAVSALVETIALAGDRLAVALPRQADDRNEIADALVTID